MARQRSHEVVGDAGTHPLTDQGGRRIHTAAEIIAGAAVRPDPAPPDMSDISSRLWTKYGPGEQPALRKELYERLERAVVEYGWPAYRVIKGCVRSADSARHPDRYFCSAVACRMREAGFLQESQGGSF